MRNWELEMGISLKFGVNGKFEGEGGVNLTKPGA